MHKSLAMPLTVFAVVGLLLIGRGLTGLVTSQTCCFGPSCAADYLCDEAPQPPQTNIPAANPMLSAQLGALLLTVLLVVYIAHQLKRKMH